MNEPENTIKRPRGRPRKYPVADNSTAITAPTELSEVLTKESAVIRQAIESQKHLSKEELKKVLIGLENQGNLYDMVRTMDEMALPSPCQRLQDRKQYRFRWLDSSDQDSFYRQLHHPIFNWKLVNRMFPEPLPDNLFDSNGAISRSRAILSYMEHELWEKWNETKTKIANERWKTAERKQRQGPFYDPVERGESTEFNTPADNRHFSGLVHEVKETHPGGFEESEGD